VKEEEEKVTKYTRAPPELIDAREAIAKFSLERAQQRLNVERNRRIGSKRKRALILSSSDNVVPADSFEKEKQDESVEQVNRLNDECAKLYKSVGNLALEASQYGDARALSAICTSRSKVGGIPLIATGSWSGIIKLWDASSPQLDLLSEKKMAHEDRIMNIAIQTPQNDVTMLATVSIDLSAKLWKISSSADDEMNVSDDDASSLHIQESAHLKGHEARLCNVAFHPMGAHVATTSFDHTWRLWDVETGKEILLQDGHARETYGVGFHRDGSLCSTTDFGGVVQVWDLRTGKSVCHFSVRSSLNWIRILCHSWY
jgi:U4/U6 small nuclear ribonucleoprotein PRP4